jgi:Ca-activated chloride channel homolog
MTARKLNLVTLLIGLLLCAAPTLAQNPKPLHVKLNVLVLDKTGAPVTDLRAEDFQVLEEGAAQKILSFTHEPMPVSYALVMDNTGSMRSQLDVAGRAGASIVAGNRAEDETAIVRFVSSDNIERVQDFTSDQARLLNAFDDLYVQGGQSAVIDAVYLSANYVTDESRRGAQRRHALVLVTDGADRKSHYKLEELLNYLRATDVQVFAIGLVQELGTSMSAQKDSRQKAVGLLDTLTKETGGRVFYPATVEQLRAAVAAIQRDLHTQYVIEYEPTLQPDDSKYRKVQVQLANKPDAEKRTVITRAGYSITQAAPPKAK